MSNKTTAQARWDRLQGYRQSYLRRAIDCSSVTIPSLIPESDLVSTRGRGQGDENLPSLFQGAGARGVSNLSAKLLLALYPPNQPFFRLTLDGQRLEQYAEAQGVQVNDDLVSQVDEGLSRLERTILLKLERLGARPVIFETIRHLIVGGNALLYVGQDGMVLYGLKSFCVDRAPNGDWTEIVVKEEVPWDEVEEVRPEDMDGREEDDWAEVYTHIQAEGDEVEWYQEVAGKKITGAGGNAPKSVCPWIPLRMHRVAGESYGRAYTEEVLGDLQSLESLMQAIVEGGLIIARDVTLVNPTGLTSMQDVATARNGDVVAGSPTDVAKLSSGDKPRDLSVMLQTVQLIERRLSFAYLMQESIQRDAERVTAEEVRQMAEQLEQTLGGVYSILSQEMQQPMIARVIAMMEKSGELPNTPSEFVTPEITTGLDSIGRGNDRARLMQFLQQVGGVLGPEALLRYVNPTELVSRLAASDGIDTKGLIKTPEEIAQEQAQAQQAVVSQQIVEQGLRNGPQSTALAGNGAGQGGAQAGPPPQG